MHTVSPEFLEAVANSQTVVTSVEVRSATGTPLKTLDAVESGSVTLDGQAEIRGRLDLALVDDGTAGLIPETPASLLAPYGNQLWAGRGVRFESGAEELVPLGRFRIEETTCDDDEDGGTLVRIAALDYAIIVSEAAFEEPYEVAGGTLFTTAILAVVTDAIPGVVSNFSSSALTVPNPGLLAEEGSDRWAFAQGMAAAMGAELYFDAEGVLILRPVPSPGAPPVLTIAEGEGGVLLGANKRWHRERTNNRVIVAGENVGATGTIPRAVATDDNPLSPTYYFGAFGKKPYFASEYAEYITTQDQAEDASQALLSARLGTTQEISFGAIVNPALEPYDVVRVKRAQLLVDEDHVLDSLTIPLAAEESMSAATRAIQVFD